MRAQETTGTTTDPPVCLPSVPVAGGGPCTVEELRGQIIPHVRAWAKHNIHFGISSRLRPAWRGILCRQNLCSTTGSASPSLQEYAQCFGVSWVDIGAPSEAAFSALQGMRETMPQEFGVTAAVANGCMLYRFPYGYPEKRGEINRHFLDAGAVEERAFPLIRMLGTHVRVVLLRIAPVYPTEGYSPGAFLEKLARCLDGLPRSYRYAVEIGNPEYLHPEYFACLRERNVAHVLNHLPPVLSVLDQVQLPHALTADQVLLRSSLQAGGPLLAPRGASGIPAGEVRLGIAETVRRCVDEKKTLYACLDEIPRSFAALMTTLDSDLARLSPIRRKAA